MILLLLLLIIIIMIHHYHHSSSSSTFVWLPSLYSTQTISPFLSHNSHTQTTHRWDHRQETYRKVFQSALKLRRQGVTEGSSAGCYRRQLKMLCRFYGGRIPRNTYKVGPEPIVRNWVVNGPYKWPKNNGYTVYNCWLFDPEISGAIWAPANWNYNPYKWVTGVITPISWVMTLLDLFEPILITGGLLGPPCNLPQNTELGRVRNSSRAT